MATLTVTEVTRAGVIVTTLTAAAAGGDQFPNTGRELVMFKNGDVAAKTVTLVTGAAGADPDGLAITDKTIVVAAGDTVVMGPFPTGIYNDASGMMNLTYSAVTSCTLKALKLPVP